MTCAAREAALELAGLAERFWANLIDTVIVPLPFILSLVIYGFIHRAKPDERVINTNVFIAGVLLSFAMVAWQFVMARKGQSVGKSALRIRVVRTDGTPASTFRVFVMRNFAPACVCIVIPLWSIVWFLDAVLIFGSGRKCLHDRFADTKVVKTDAVQRVSG